MAMVTTAELRDYLGVDEDSDGIIAREREAALQSLRVGTGIDWSQETDHALSDLAGEAVQIMVWLSFYATRSNIGNEDHLRRRLTAIMIQLENGGVPDAENEQGDTTAPTADG